MEDSEMMTEENHLLVISLYPIGNVFKILAD